MHACPYRPVLAIIALLLISACTASQAELDPLAALQSKTLTGSDHIRAMEVLDASAPNDPETIKALNDVVGRDSYAVAAREEALNRLVHRDLAGLKSTIRQTLPRSKSWDWVQRCSEIIEEHDWKDLSPALASSWARPVAGQKDDLKRPEYKAIAKMHGEENVTDVIFNMFMESKSVSQQGLRTRCWDLLHRLGQRERLVNLLATSEAAPNDAMMIDLHAGAVELGIVPRNREEILWLRKLRQQDRAEFWASAVKAVKDLSPQRRVELELRDIPILVSASLYDHELLQATTADLYARADAALRDVKHYVQESNYDNMSGSSHQMLGDYRDKLTWGDLAAIQIALRAMQVPEVVHHLFNYADRDMADTSTEYGGIIALDGKDRFEVREFQPIVRRHDQEFNASQAMLDEAYTSIFHFHLHAQNFRNNKYAGPGFGDLNYADNTLANCLVFTFMNEDTLNVDFYRHDRVVVDLGVIKRN